MNIEAEATFKALSSKLVLSMIKENTNYCRVAKHDGKSMLDNVSHFCIGLPKEDAQD